MTRSLESLASRRGYRAARPLLVVLSLLVAAPAWAISDADEVCAPTDDPCIADNKFDVDSGSTLDFGLRELRIQSGGDFDFADGSGGIRCGKLVVDRGSNAAILAQNGGFVEIEVRRSCSNDPLIPCLSPQDCGGEACSGGDGSIDFDGQINANGSFENSPGVVILRAAGDIALHRNLNLKAVSDPEEDGGQFEAESFGGSVVLDGKVDVTSGGQSTGGDVVLAAAVDVITTGVIDANGGDFDGGNVEIDAGQDVTINNDVLANAISGEGSGGFVEMTAGRDFNLLGTGGANKTQVSTEGHLGPYDFGGDGGTQEFQADRDVTLNQFSRIEGNGAEPDALGADIFVAAGQDVFLQGEIEAKAKGGDGAGGSILVESDRDTTFGATGTIDLTGGSDGGGLFEVFADRDFTNAGTIDVTAGGNGAGGSAFIDAKGDVTVSGTIVSVGGTGLVSDGKIEIEGCNLTVTSTGDIDNRATNGRNLLVAASQMTLSSGGRLRADDTTGTNTLRYRDAITPPIVNATVTPAATMELDPTIVGCPVCGNGVIEEPETCDDGNTTSGDGCRNDCVSEGCIADTPGFPAVELCDDMIDCTLDDCDGSECTHVAQDSLCDDSERCTDDVCNAMTGCVSANNSDVCNDGLFCTNPDSCDMGTCSNTPDRDCGDAVDCTIDTCSEGTNQCVNTPDDSSCDDGLFCDGAEICNALTGCEEGTPVDCSGLDDQCAVGTCNETSDACEATPANEAAACDDGLFCTLNDACASGTCTGDAPDCSGLDDQCNQGVCTEEAEGCTAQNINEGQPCDDGLACTENDVCTAGVCAGTPLDCSGLSDECVNGVCTEEAMGCVAEPIDEGGACDDGLFCTDGDICTGGTCAGTPRTCDDGVGCTNDSCDEDGDACVNEVDDGNCDDGAFCNGAETCDAVGDCQAGTDVDCSGLEGPCVTASCNEGTDACEATNVGNGTGCDDGLFCTDGDQCTDGTCAGSARDCTDGVDCTNDSCDEGGDACVNEVDDSNCDDGAFCNGAETCDAVSDCQAGTDVDCSGLDGACTTGVCDDDGDACAAENVADTTPCDDGRECTENDQCTAGVCAGSEIPPGCDQCGNGLVEGDEDCDDGDTEHDNGEFCAEDCSLVACGQPTDSGGPRPTASDALFTLRAAVGQASCDRRVCDVDDSGRTTATDALIILKVAVGGAGSLDCPTVLL